eukprot:5443915-Prymnesium_polylepis.1
MLVCASVSAGPRVTPNSEKDVEEEECGATGSARVRRHYPGYRHPRGAAPAASPVHSPLPMYSIDDCRRRPPCRRRPCRRRLA